MISEGLKMYEWSNVFLVLSQEFMYESKKCEKHLVSTHPQSPHNTDLQSYYCLSTHMWFTCPAEMQTDISLTKSCKSWLLD